MKTLNERTVTLKLKRIDVCNLLLATTILSQNSDASKWKRLHYELKQILNEFDEKNAE